MKDSSTPNDPSQQLTEQLIARIAKGGGITLVGSGFGRIVQFGFHILLGRVLGAGGYGLYTLGYSVIQLARELSTLGLHHGIVRFIAIYRSEGELRRIKGTIVSAFFTAGIASLIVGFFLFVGARFVSLSIFNDPELTSVLRAFAIAVPFFVLIDMSAHTARGFQRMEHYVAIQDIIWPIANVVFVGIVFLLGYRLMGAVYGFLASVVISATAGILSIPRRIFPEFLSLRPTYEIRKLLRFSLAMILIGFGQIALSQTDRLIVGFFMTSADVGMYSAAARIAIQCNFIITAFNMAFAPMIADLHNKQRIAEMEQLFKLVTRWIVALTLPIILVLVLFPVPVMKLFGGEFVAGSGVLIALAVAYLVNVATGSVGLILIMAGNQNIELLNVLGMAAVNVGLNVWLIQIYGILGVAIATGLSSVIVNVIRVIEVYKLIGIQPYTRKFLKPLLVAGAVILLLKLLTDWMGLDFHWAIGLALCPVLYIGIMMLLGLEKEDTMIIQVLWKKLSLLFSQSSR
jgi:O-antigen/teichoic acid export membrane protein